MAGRRSAPKVSAGAPTHEQLVPLVRAAANVADHGALRPWRLIELRGDARNQLGRAMASAAGKHGDDGDKLAAKPLRADLLIAVVACRKPSHKVEVWEQDAAASGVAHILSLLLGERALHGLLAFTTESVQEGDPVSGDNMWGCSCLASASAAQMSKRYGSVCVDHADEDTCTLASCPRSPSTDTPRSFVWTARR